MSGSVARGESQFCLYLRVGFMECQWIWVWLYFVAGRPRGRRVQALHTYLTCDQD
jgi:hypothetical protein